MRSRWRSRRSRSRPSRARRSWRPTASASASPRAPATIRSARSASSPRSDARPSCGPEPGARPRADAPHARFPVVASGDARARAQCADQCPPVHRARWRQPRPRRPISPASTACSTARIRAKDMCAAAASCIRGSASPSWRRKASRSTTRAQAVLGIKDGGGQALRLDVVRVPAEQTLTDYLNSGWIENIDPRDRRGRHHQRLPGGDRGRPRRSMDVPAVRGPLRQRRLPLHLRDQADGAGGRPCVPGSGRKLPPHEHRRGELPPSRCVSASCRSSEGDTVERLAARMATDRKEERFRILNGLGAHRPPARGRSGEDRDGVKRRSASARPRESGDPD